VPSRGVKPILGLIVLLAWPCLGLGSRAEAGFALEAATPTAERTPGSLGFEFHLILNGEEPAKPEETCSSTGSEKAPAPFTPGDAPRSPYRDLLLVPGGLSNGASSAGSPPSTGPGSGPALSFVVPSGIGTTEADSSGRLFLADERIKPPPFDSRLFRPPR
jgi:hypothetical protein